MTPSDFPTRLGAQGLCVALAVLVLGACGPKAPCFLVSGAEAKKLLVPGTVLLDARPRKESQSSHIDGSIAVPRSEFSYRLTNLDLRSRIVVFAESRDAAYEAAEELRSRGFTVYELGTVNDWKSTETKCED